PCLYGHSSLLCLSFVTHVSPLFFFNDAAPPEIYTLSLHDALPISSRAAVPPRPNWSRVTPAVAARCGHGRSGRPQSRHAPPRDRSEEHTSELQSLAYLVCRLLLEKKKQHRQKIRMQTTDTSH